MIETNHVLTVKKHAYRQSNQGIVISFLVHPDDMTPELAGADLGTAYKIGLVEVDENEQPSHSSTGSEHRNSTPGVGGSNPPAPAKRFHELKRSQQAGILCNDPGFQFWYGTDVYPDPAEETAGQVRSDARVESRSEFDKEGPAAVWWDETVKRYRQETGQEPEPRG